MLKKIEDIINGSGRGVICLNSVRPIRIVACLMLAGNWAYILLNLDSIGMVMGCATLLNLVLVLMMFNACRRSKIFHAELSRLEGKGIRGIFSD